jgi:hypothetical protein
MPMINGTQPVPGQPPRIWPNDPYQGGSATTMPMQPPPPSMFFNPDGSPMFTGGGKDSTGMPLISDGPGNRGSGQPINQPMGSLQSLGGGQLNQSGMVTLRGTDGTTKAIPQSDVAHWLSRGAVRV